MQIFILDGSLRAETFDEALSAAYLTNPTLMSVRAQLRATDEGVPQALSGWTPTVTMSGSNGRGAYTSTLKPKYTISRSPTTEALNISQPLYQGGGTVAATRQARNLVRAGQEYLTSTEQTVLLAAAQAYLDVARDELILKLNISNEQLLRRQRETVTERLKVHEATITDLSQADARVAGAVYSRALAESALQNSRAAYLHITGHLPEYLQMPERPSGLPQGLPAVLQQASAANPDIAAAEFNRTAAVNGVDVIKSQLLPSVSLNGDVTRGLQSSTTYDQVATKEVLLNLTMPLYPGGGTYAKVRAQKDTVSQLTGLVEDERRSVTEGATQAWETLQSCQAQIEWLDRQIKANEQALAGLEDEARLGLRTVIELLNGQQELFTSRVNMVVARHDELLAIYQIRQAMGTMTAKALDLHVPLYDPTLHAEEVEHKWWGLGGDVDAPGR